MDGIVLGIGLAKAFHERGNEVIRDFASRGDRGIPADQLRDQ